MGDDRCDICCRPRSAHKGRDLQCNETTYFRPMPVAPAQDELVERLTKDRDRWQGISGARLVELQDRLDDVTRLTEERDALVEGLQWYAQPHIYAPHPNGPAFDDRDLSWHARSVLAKVKREGGEE